MASLAAVPIIPSGASVSHATPPRSPCASPSRARSPSATRKASSMGHRKRLSVSSATHAQQYSPSTSTGGDQDDNVVAMACTFCRQRKIKCNGTKPMCSACTTYGRKCVYQAVTPEENAALRLAKRTRRARLAASMILSASSLQPSLMNQQLVANTTSYSKAQSAQLLDQIAGSIEGLKRAGDSADPNDPDQPANQIRLSEDGAATHASTPVNLDALLANHGQAQSKDRDVFTSLNPMCAIPGGAATPFRNQAVVGNHPMSTATPYTPADHAAPPQQEFLSGYLPSSSGWIGGLPGAPLPSPLNSEPSGVVKPNPGPGHQAHSTMPAPMHNWLQGAPSMPLMPPSSSPQSSLAPPAQTPVRAHSLAESPASESFWHGMAYNPHQMAHSQSVPVLPTAMFCNPNSVVGSEQSWLTPSVGTMPTHVSIPCTQAPVSAPAALAALSLGISDPLAATSAEFPAVSTAGRPVAPVVESTQSAAHPTLLGPITFPPALEPGWQTDSSGVGELPFSAEAVPTMSTGLPIPLSEMDLSSTPSLSPSLSPWPAEAGRFDVPGCSRREQRRPDIVNPGMYRVINAMEKTPEQVSDLARRRSQPHKQVPNVADLSCLDPSLAEPMLTDHCHGLLDDSINFDMPTPVAAPMDLDFFSCPSQC